jgi:hypothetical protein
LAKAALVHTLRCSPSGELALELKTDNLGALELPKVLGHDFDNVGTTDTACNYTETTGVRGVRVGSNHEPIGERVVLENDLVNDTGTGLPEIKPVL